MIAAPINLIIAAWPALIGVLAWRFHIKQNSCDAWTGGPISWPKSFWLAFTILTWFFLPILFLLHSEFPRAAVYLIGFHLASWWARGILELVMIYKWKNWSPRYGITHDLFHIAGILTVFQLTWTSFEGPLTWLIISFTFLVVYSTAFELFFAWKFLTLRTQQQASENIYFADDSPQWRLVNRVTAIGVWSSLGHLTVNGCLLLF